MDLLFGSKAVKPPTLIAHPPHPFYPLEVEIVGYLANDKDALQLLTVFFSGWLVILGATWCGVSTYSPQVKTLDKTIILWFVMTGIIHFFFEGYFALNHTHMAPAQDLFGQLWKEYAKSDSRYLTSDPFVLCMETITAVCWGPLSMLMAYLITVQHPLRYPIQAIVSLGQIYGDILYYATSMFDFYYKGLTYSRPEAYYFWFYFFFMNFIWIVIPGFLLYQSVSRTAKAFAALDNMGRSPQANGGVKAATNGAVKKPHANGHVKKNA